MSDTIFALHYEERNQNKSIFPYNIYIYIYIYMAYFKILKILACKADSPSPDPNLQEIGTSGSYPIWDPIHD